MINGELHRGEVLQQLRGNILNFKIADFKDTASYFISQKLTDAIEQLVDMLSDEDWNVFIPPPPLFYTS